MSQWYNDDDDDDDDEKLVTAQALARNCLSQTKSKFHPQAPTSNQNKEINK